MNERIKELAAAARHYTNDTVLHLERVHNRDYSFEEINEILDTKFAELIVKECLKDLRHTVVDTQECRQGKSMDYQVGWEDGMFDAGEAIKEHFGVKE
jgi:hypothetical protein